MLNPLVVTIVPVVAATAGAAVAQIREPGPRLVSGIQHFAAGVVFAAAASEILPEVLHGGSAAATLVGGVVGVAVMLGLKGWEERAKGPAALLGAIGIDLLIDGLVLGLAFIGGQKAGRLLTVALTLEVLFLGLSVSAALGGAGLSKLRIVGVTLGLALLVPAGVLVASPVSLLPPVVIAGALSFGLMALLYLVTEELLVEAHETPDSPLTTSAFFVGFLALLLLEELTS